MEMTILQAVLCGVVYWLAVGEYLHLCNRLKDFLLTSPSGIVLNLSNALGLKKSVAL